MNTLRVYINPTGATTQSPHGVFYSRRADGPYYCWRYEEGLGRWLSSRVNLPDFTRRALCIASWKVVPAALQSKLDEHYLE